ncbi:GNAT family N-acetyltransferase [Leifsonia sp. PS1209]|uniref:GNAT family N-acetyltransferase n=1 Tax=Leifsonia sp. PS1209 TaxID=2724914 RepID=UPI000A1997D3|nr:GNAT family N-acetyltransferase [Leifsonia sp. PS1209]QIZ98405.1 GNAT family N-acetyltransferase [Leifsonia sp. PS1209]
MSGQPSAVIEVASVVDDELVDAVVTLLPQLSSSATFDRALLERVVASEAATLFVARLDGAIVGMATLVAYAIPTGLRGHIDDVVVDESTRGRGVARSLLEAMIARSAELGIRTLDLTSRPSRVAAIRLYESVGFVRRDTNTFRFAG